MNGLRLMTTVDPEDEIFNGIAESIRIVRVAEYLAMPKTYRNRGDGVFREERPDEARELAKAGMHVEVRGRLRAGSDGRPQIVTSY